MRRSFSKLGGGYRYVGSPVKMKGPGQDISSSILSTKTAHSGRMKVHCLSGYISNLYVCEYVDHKELLVLDTGMPKDIDRFEFYINNVIRKGYRDEENEKGIRGGADDTVVKEKDDDDAFSMERNLKLVVSSHCHIDHIGSAWAFKERNIEVQAAKNYEDYYRGASGKVQQVIDAGLATFLARRLGRSMEWPFVPFTSKVALNENIQMEDGTHVHGFSDWVAIACPGHTCHMNMLYHPETQFLYAADFLIAHKNEFRAPVPVDLDYAYIHTLERLRKLPVRFVLLAHGGVIDCEDVGGWQAILDEVTSHLKKPATNLIMMFIYRFLLGFSPEPKLFDRSRLPKKPLPTAAEDPPFVAFLK